MMGLGSLLFAWAPSLPLAMAARFLVGFGAAFIFIALLRQQVNWFDKGHFAQLTGLTVLVGNLGALAGIGPFALLVTHLGWRRAFLLPSLVALAFSAAVAVVVRNSPAPRRDEHGIGLGESIALVLRNRTNYLTFVSFGLCSGVYLTFGGLWGVPFLRHVHGMDTLQASVCTTLLMAGMAVGSLLTPLFVRLCGSPRNGGVLMLGVTGLLWAVVFFAPLPLSWPPALYGLFCLLGVGISGSILVYTTIRECNPERAMGTALAFTNTGGFIAIAVLQVLVGVILDRFVGSAVEGVPVYPPPAYRLAFGLLLVLHFVGVAAFALVREPREDEGSTGGDTSRSGSTVSADSVFSK
ncbi:MAG: MFS transporter [Chitinivibrionales bacterium]|nr:MFS transporter [Chitinivibrionales bacterium]